MPLPYIYNSLFTPYVILCTAEDRWVPLSGHGRKPSTRLPISSFCPDNKTMLGRIAPAEPEGTYERVLTLRPLSSKVTTTTDLVVVAVPEQGERCGLGNGIDLE